uniref:Uncharacterized protein n=1 Tax=Arion vulgaris TaxID=1028688 RepID=A0A0B6Z9L7_9EUPU
MLPGRRDRKWPEPTSGNKPIAHSGIQNTALSVATQNRPSTVKPAAPPKVIPFSMEMRGFGKVPMI